MVHHSQLDELVSELSRQSGPRIVRAELMLDLIQQALGQLRNRLGSATVEEEQSLTDFLVLEDYVAGHHRTWNLERPALERAQRRRAKELAQLAPVVRMLAVVARAVDEAASALGAAMDPVELLPTAKLLHDLVQTAFAAVHGYGDSRVEASWRELLRVRWGSCTVLESGRKGRTLRPTGDGHG